MQTTIHSKNYWGGDLPPLAVSKWKQFASRLSLHYDGSGWLGPQGVPQKTTHVWLAKRVTIAHIIFIAGVTKTR